MHLLQITSRRKAGIPPPWLQSGDLSMKIICRMIFAIAAVSCAAYLQAAIAANSPAPQAAQFYPLLGKWKGSGKLIEGDQAPKSLSLRLNCRKASSGWAVLCELKASNSKMIMTETDLFGVDPVSGKSRWYAVTNRGETHDHIAEWVDPKNMRANLAWTQEGKQMSENITFHFVSSRSIEFRSVIAENRKEAVSFTGSFKR
jgi:hypothetical protein